VKRRRWVKWILISLTVLLLAAIGDYHLYAELPIEGKSFDRGANGLWLRYTWYFGQHSDHDYQELAKRLQQGHFKYAYFHVRSVDARGDLKTWLPQRARELNVQIRTLCPEVKRIAWVFIDRKTTNIGEEKVRKDLAATARKLIRDGGFQGVQCDYEVCADGDRNFLQLLEETRRTVPKNALLSVAAPTWMPWPITSIGWSENYFSQVAKLCDQIAVMAYDTGFYFPRSYVWLVGQDASRVPRAVLKGNPECKVLLGLPTYVHGGASHNPKAENLRMGLKGVKAGLDGRESPAFEGVAVFADYTTRPEDWKAYEQLWAKP